MNLLDILACPGCQGPVRRSEDSVECTRCSRLYPWNHGRPVMLANSMDAASEHEGDLGERPGYARWKERIVIKSLSDRDPILDFGAGRQALDDPCIIRMDLQPSRYIDLAGDLMSLPFRDSTISFAFGGAVMEHVPDPARVVRELYRVIRPGGYVYADWSSVFAYHGYPHHYFNATLTGIRKAFADFTVLEAGVAPFHGGAFALRSVLNTYKAHFKPRTLREHWFAADLDAILWAPLDAFDRRFDPADRFRVAAGVYVFAVKQPSGTETLIPPPVLDALRRDPQLGARFPEPLNIARPDNLLLWAKTDGARLDPAIRASLESGERFSKWADPARAFDRGAVDSWPLELMDAVDPLPTTRWELGPIAGRRIGFDVSYGRFKRGLVGAVRRRLEAIWRWLRSN